MLAISFHLDDCVSFAHFSPSSEIPSWARVNVARRLIGRTFVLIALIAGLVLSVFAHDQPSLDAFPTSLRALKNSSSSERSIPALALLCV